MDAAVIKAITENLTVPVETAGKALGLGRNSAYQAVKGEQIPSIRLGRKIVVPTAPLRQMLGLEGAQAPAE
jgi:hypothetical protein